MRMSGSRNLPCRMRRRSGATSIQLGEERIVADEGQGHGLALPLAALRGALDVGDEEGEGAARGEGHGRGDDARQIKEARSPVAATRPGEWRHAQGPPSLPAYAGDGILGQSRYAPGRVVQLVAGHDLQHHLAHPPGLVLEAGQHRRGVIRRPGMQQAAGTHTRAQ